ncbi:unnamed protein product [Parnassius mnemosyne]|uniref:Uncharacterized protein n=1 Tax=Parnassius mnemosyne TaxID=213953 RepID=A0AAV1KR19_9NEOP
MAFDPAPAKIADINLDNYFLDHQFYNTDVYVHKKFLPKSKINEKSRHEVKPPAGIVEQGKHDKNQQCEREKGMKKFYNEKKKIHASLHDDSVIEQTVKFAKTIIPRVIPPSREYSPTPVFYTIKTSKKLGKKLSKLSSINNEHCEKFNKTTPKAVAKKADEEKVRVHSAMDACSHSSPDNTLDEFHINQSSNFSLSESSANDPNKISQNKRKREHDIRQKDNPSESLKAIATEVNTSNQVEIKISLMNDSEKSNFIESLKAPVINSFNEYLNELNSPLSEELQGMKKILASNTQKLDYMVQILGDIENKIIRYSDKTTKIIMSPKTISSKASRLEELAGDLTEIKEGTITDDEENYETDATKPMTTKSALVTMIPNHQNNGRENKNENVGYGDSVPIHLNAACSQLGVKPDRPNRIPARFCWTDTTKNV